jgi:cytoskeletal protein CcmA (bactofilin family)
MEQGAHIGSTIVIKGEISAKEPLIVSGRVEGTISAPGCIVTIEAGAEVHADIEAAGIIVSGAVHGALLAEERISLRAGADVEGNLTAPRIVVEDGAFARGQAAIAGAEAGVTLARAS